MAAPKMVNFMVSFLSLLVVFFMIMQSHFVMLYHYQVDSVSKEDIYLPIDVVDPEATEKLKEKKKTEIQPVMFLDFSKLVTSKRELSDFFSRLFEVKESYKENPQMMKQIYAGIERKNAYNFTEQELMDLAILSTNRLNTILNYASDITSQKMISGITQKQIDDGNKDIEAYVESLELIKLDKKYLLKFISGALQENLFVDEAKTEEKIAAELEKIEPVKLKSGTLLISSGQKIDENVYNILKEGDMLVESTKDYWISIGKIVALLALIWGVMHAYLYAFDKKTLYNTKPFAILMSLFILAFVSSAFFAGISPYSIPVAAYVMLVVMLVSAPSAIGSGIMLVFLLQVLHEFSISLVLAYLLIVILGSVLLKSVKQRTQIITSGVLGSLLLFGVTYTHAFVLKDTSNMSTMDIVYSLLNGPISAVLTIGIMPFYEMLFAALTPFKLLELSNPNKPLLKRLLIEAPGTYHHSILVGNLAETAAHDIKANSLLTRVAAFYHDVGKLDRPFYFKENQISGENPHDKLPPQISANVIREHMIHGVQLCEKNKLPKEIIEVIKAHHGNSLIKYFYFQEQKNNPNVDITKFVYPGPKPKSRESVILMLADSVEAAVRTLENPTKASLQELIDKIVQQKIEEKQFTDAEMTFRELERVKKSFINVLSGIFHERIVYPEIDMKNVQKDVFEDSEEK